MVSVPSLCFAASFAFKVLLTRTHTCDLLKPCLLQTTWQCGFFFCTICFLYSVWWLSKEIATLQHPDLSHLIHGNVVCGRTPTHTQSQVWDRGVDNRQRPKCPDVTLSPPHCNWTLVVRRSSLTRTRRRTLMPWCLRTAKPPADASAAPCQRYSKAAKGLCRHTHAWCARPETTCS